MRVRRASLEEQIIRNVRYDIKKFTQFTRFVSCLLLRSRTDAARLHADKRKKLPLIKEQNCCDFPQEKTSRLKLRKRTVATFNHSSYERERGGGHSLSGPLDLVLFPEMQRKGGKDTSRKRLPRTGQGGLTNDKDSSGATRAGARAFFISEKRPACAAR